MMRTRKHQRRLAAIFACSLLVGVVGACGDDDDGASPTTSIDGSTDADTSDLRQDGPGDAGSTADVDGGPIRAAFGLSARPANPSCHAPARPMPAAPVTVQRVYADLDFGGIPMMMVQAPDDPSKWFVPLLQSGNIVTFPVVGSTTTPTIVANVAALAGIPLSIGGESGLLGIAFHPQFKTNGRIYASWNSQEGTAIHSRVGYITSTDGGLTFTSYTNLIDFDQPGLYYHHGGSIAFGPDGYLYVGFGDGGDPNNGLLRGGFFSKILRIDVNAIPPGQPFGIPKDNPFALDGGEPSTYAYGLRNPFRFAFDRGTGDLWVGDVGESAYEEIDLVKLGGNYGWDCREGLHANPAADASTCAVKANALDPVLEVDHQALSRSIVGGRIYRGAQIPSLIGSYVFGDYSRNEVDVLSFDPTTGLPSTTIINANEPTMPIVSFAEDHDGEVYVVNFDGTLYKVIATPTDAGGAPPVSTFPDRLSKSGCDPATNAGLIPYGVNAPSWNDGVNTDRWISLPDGTTINVTNDGHFALPTGSIAVQTFKIAGTKIETRLLVRHDDGAFAGYSYEWLDDQSDALLLPSSKRKAVGGGSLSWSFPSRSDCVHCHSATAGSVLGLEVGQLNGDFVYASTNLIANQLQTLSHIGVFSTSLDPAQNVAYPDPSRPGPLEPRARSYLHSNCSMCHRGMSNDSSGGATGDGGAIDLRFSSSLINTNTCGVDAQGGDLGVGAKILTPGSPAKSQLSLRPHALDATRMPTLGSSVIDTNGIAVLDDWITSLVSCP